MQVSPWFIIYELFMGFMHFIRAQMTIPIFIKVKTILSDFRRFLLLFYASVKMYATLNTNSIFFSFFFPKTTGSDN